MAARTGRSSKRPTCEDCFFQQNLLCSLDRSGPCPTFRAADRGLKPERQLTFAFRSPHAHSVYAFPQPR